MRLTAHLLFATALAVPFAATAAPLHLFHTVVISPDGQHVAAIENDDVPVDGEPPATLVIHDMAGGAATVALPCAPSADCKVGSPVWNADGSRLAFVIQHNQGLAGEIDTVPATGGTPQRLVSFDGPLDGLRYGPGDRLAVLATASPHKRVGRTQAAAVIQGDAGNEIDEQRIAVVEGDRLRFISPADLYVYEFDWRPDGGFVGTAAHGDGDANWWVARLYGFDNDGASRVLFTPSPREQMASPVVSPDGASVAFIGGWMSDFGSTGGDAYLLKLGRSATPVDLTPQSHSTVTSIDWHCGPGLTGVTLSADQVAVTRLDQAGRALWSGSQSLSADGESMSLSCGPHGVAAVSQSFTSPPEIVAGPIGQWRPITRVNDGTTAPLTARSLTWTNDGQTVQGWLLQPNNGAPDTRRPMIVLVHGGPEAAASPRFPQPRGTVAAMLAQGWDVLEPNYRGSYGQGEAFASASIQDLGGGDWRDVLTGVDAAEHAAPIDDARLGITGGSYGGYMTMWAVTQTHRFRAGVSDAGVSDWLSIEGEAPQAGSDQVNFGGSVYDNAAPYLKASPIMHMRGVNTPVLIAVGERDVECPMPQSQEYYTAMQALGVPTDMVVYPGEGHGLNKQADRDDLNRRTIAWFGTWFGKPR
ncbi:prolyl oligopeptidase family serine peptidase [Lichenicola sp.]|uniref:S9 family peptidase n=1 Tax=Lichenicola sp. TaxID=2804529 RepID=UPI003AFF9871